MFLQCIDMSHDAGGECREIIAAFQRGDHAAAGMRFRDLADRGGHPAEIIFRPVEICQRVGCVGVKSGPKR